MSDLTPERKSQYELMVSDVRAEIEENDDRIQDILAEAQDKILSLKQAKEASLTIYAGLCARLGIENEFEDEEDEDDE